VLSGVVKIVLDGVPNSGLKGVGKAIYPTALNAFQHATQHALQHDF
jgi:hypothetical protein